MISKIHEKKSAKEMFAYVNKDDGEYLGGTLIFNSESEFLNDFNSYQGTKKFQKPCLHIVLSVLKDEPLSDEEWLEATEIYLKEMGLDPTTFGWAAVKHTDTQHHHIHILSTKNSLENVSWSSSFSKYKSIEACGKVEQQLNLNNRQSSNLTDQFRSKKGLAAVKKQPSNRHHHLKRMEEKNPETANIFKRIQATIGQVILANKDIPMSQFKALLAQDEIELDILTTPDKSSIRGLIYRHTPANSNEQVSFKASEFGEAFLFKKLSKQRGFWNDLSAPPPPKFKPTAKIKIEEDQPAIISIETKNIILPIEHSVTDLEDEPFILDTNPAEKIIKLPIQINKIRGFRR